MNRLPRRDFIRAHLEREVEAMLEELGAPPLVERIFPEGWRNCDDTRLGQLYDLCIRTYQEREAAELRGQSNLAALQEVADAQGWEAGR